MKNVSTSAVLLVSIALIAPLTGCGAQLLAPRMLDDNSQACVERALTRRQGDVAVAASAAAELEVACRAHEAAACSTLGVMVEHGRGIGQDPVRAAQLYELACRGNNARGCYHLGRLRVGVDDVEASALLQRGCDAGVAESCTALASLRPAQSWALLERGCDGGDSDACRLLGDRHFGSDPFNARVAFEKACTAGDEIACARLDAMFAQTRELDAPRSTTTLAVHAAHQE